jgi:hypothetical protein
MELANDISRSLFSLHVNPPHVLAKQADADELKTAEEQHGHEQRSIARDISPPHQSSQYDEAGIEKSQDCRQAAGVRAQPQWLYAEAGQTLEREVQQRRPRNFVDPALRGPLVYSIDAVLKPS